jgi:hypothetical protein
MTGRVLALALAVAGTLVAFRQLGGGAGELPSSVPTATPRAAIPDPPDPGTEPPTAAEPEVLAAWFEEAVLRELEANTPRANAAGPTRPSQAGIAGALEPRQAGLDPLEPEPIDWAYIEAVFEGRISGIPNEHKAGLSLQEMDEIGDIPYVEQLRAESRFEELRALGFENETVPWPACMRTASCRRDAASSPP